MSTTDTNLETETGTGRRYPTVGANAADLVAFEAVETATGDLLVYDDENEDAWLQSDVYGDCADLV